MSEPQPLCPAILLLRLLWIQRSCKLRNQLESLPLKIHDPVSSVAASSPYGLRSTAIPCTHSSCWGRQLLYAGPSAVFASSEGLLNLSYFSAHWHPSPRTRHFCYCPNKPLSSKVSRWALNIFWTLGGSLYLSLGESLDLWYQPRQNLSQLAGVMIWWSASFISIRKHSYGWCSRRY